MNNPDIVSLIIARSNSLSPKSKKVADYIVNNPDIVINLSINELAEAAGVSQFSVVSCVRSLGFDGYADFKISLALSLNKNVQLFGNITSTDDPYSVLIKTCQSKAHYINDAYTLIERENYNIILDLILQAGHINIFAVGYSAFAAEYLSINLFRLGYNTRYFRDAHYQVISASLLGKNDFAIAISSSGSTESVVESLKTAKENGCPTLAITCYSESELTKYADNILLTTYSGPALLKKTNNSILEQITIASAITLAVANKDSTKAIEMFSRTSSVVEH